MQDRVALERLSPAELSALTESVAQAAEQLRQLEQPWLVTIRGELRNPVFAGTWRDQMKAIGEGIEELAAWHNRLLGHSVALPGEGLPPKELLDQLGQLRDRLAVGKGVSKLLQKDLFRVREACRVDEEPPQSAEDVELCILEARTRRRRYVLTRRWNDAIARVRGPLLNDGTSHSEYELSDYAEGLRAAFGWEEGGWDALRADSPRAGSAPRRSRPRVTWPVSPGRCARRHCTSGRSSCPAGSTRCTRTWPTARPSRGPATCGARCWMRSSPAPGTSWGRRSTRCAASAGLFRTC